MTNDAIIWTEGKTDGQYLMRALDVLTFPYSLSFQVTDEMGDDQLLKQCQALARVPQPHPTIFIFDRDSPDIVRRVENGVKPYKVWGNNVFSFAIPIPDHRPDMTGTCIELYFSDDDLSIKDFKGRRLFLSSEFNQSSGRHLTDTTLSVAHKGKLPSGKSVAIRILDAEVYDAAHRNVALSKADFANYVVNAVDEFGGVDFKQFNKLFSIINEIMQTISIDLAFGGMHEFMDALSESQKPQKLAAAVEAAIRMCKLSTIIFTGLTIRYYDSATVEKLESDPKKIRPISQSITENFTAPSLSTLIRTARQCYHLVDDRAPHPLQDLRAMMAENPVLGPIGDLLDDIERVIPPDSRRGRTIVKRNTKKQLLEYVFAELAKYESRISEIRSSEADALDGADDSIWLRAISMLADLLSPIRALCFRVGNIVRLQTDSDNFVVRLTSYSNGRARTEELFREYADLSSDRLETYEVKASSRDEDYWLDIYPFVIIKDEIIHLYTRTRAIGYEYRPVFGPSVQIIPTKRRFSHAALRGTTAADRQMLFWTRVAPAVSGAGVKANIPAHDPNEFVGRKQQIATIMDEVIQIPNENGLLHGPGGVGKTALLIELSRKLFEEGLPTKAPFKHIIWISAKRDYYDPTLNVIEAGSQQFKSLDQVFLSILAFHGFEEPEQYSRNDQRWLVLELFEEQKTLLVLDNLETVPHTAQEEIVRFFGTEVKRHLIDKPDNFKVLLTSREMIPSGFHQIQLKGLDKRESNLLMQRVYQPYAQSGQAQLTDAQRSQLYDATKGIPLLIKHCYGQIFEYNMSFDGVVRNLVVAGNKVVEFSFAEIFRFLKEDELQRKVMILLELINRPILIRQIADILSIDQSNIESRISNLLNFQCIVRSASDIDDRYSINPDVRLLAARLVHDSATNADAIRRDIARLATEKRIDYNKEEFDAFVIFQQYLDNGLLAQAEDFIEERLKERPDSILFNLHYAMYIKEQKHQPREAILRLEKIRKSSGNDLHVLRLLMMYNTAVEPPNFDQAHIYAKELETYLVNDSGITLDIAEFYTEWSTFLKLKIEIDPLKERLRQQKYKELSDHAISLLRSQPDETPHRWHYLYSQCHFNRWDYDAAKRSIDQAIARLPAGSYLCDPYERLREEIVKKARLYQRLAESRRGFH